MNLSTQIRINDIKAANEADRAEIRRINRDIASRKQRIATLEKKK